MKREQGKLFMARLATIRRRRADLQGELAALEAQEAKLFEELAEGEVVDLRTLRAVPREHLPALPVASETDQARAVQLLQKNATRRRLRA